MAHQYYHQQKHHLETLPYRLRSTRQRRRALITDRDKQLIAIDRERCSLRKKQRDQPWIPLDAPFMRGWKRSFVLREDVARSKDAQFYARILEKINTVQFSHRRDFKRKKRSKGKKIHVVRGQHLAQLYPYEWTDCAFSPTEAALFDLVAEPPSKPHLPLRFRYVFRESWRFVLRVQPNMITKVRQPDAELEAALTAISSYLDDQEKNGRLDKIRYGGTYKSRWKDEDPIDPVYSRRPFRNMPLHVVVEEE